MVKASGQIEQELRALQDKTELMESILDPLYEGYLKALSEAGQRQLVMAAYYLCTKAYPDKFLALSWDNRNRLQQDLQTLAAQIHTQLSEQREEAKTKSRRPQNSDGLAFLQRLLESRMSLGSSGKARSSKREDRSTAELFNDDEEDFIPSAEEDFDEDTAEHEQSDSSEEDTFDIRSLELEDTAETHAFDAEGSTDSAADLDIDAELDLEADSEANESEDGEIDFEVEVPAADDRLSVDEEEDLLAALEGLARRSIEMREGSAGSEADGNESEEEQPLTPIHLIKQQMLMERSIREVFKTISEEANDLLQKANVMPSFPKSLLAAAVEPGGIGEPANAVPNVVRVSVRVMHGEAMFKPDDDELGEDAERSGRDRSDRESRNARRDDEYDSDHDGDSRDSDSGRRNSRSSRDSGSSRDFRRDSRRRSRSFNRSASNRNRSSSRRRGGRSPQMIPHDIIELGALPELSAISLRLSEVEFTDPTVSAWRSRLRQKLGDLKKLGGRYKKTQRSLETAKAEDAWRSSWTIRPPEADRDYSDDD